jgi:fucose 4-O-acetylase-like acetyltransferase
MHPNATYSLIPQDFYKDIAVSLGVLRLPLFASLAGFMFAYSRKPKNGAFLSNKVHAILIPAFIAFLITAIIQLLAGELVPTVVRQPRWAVWEFFVDPPYHFWYCHALFLIFAVTVALERLGVFGSSAKTVFAVGCGFVASLIPIPSVGMNVMGWHGALGLLPYFLIGIGLQRFWMARISSKVGWTCAAVASVGLATMAYCAFQGTPVVRTSPIWIGTGILTLVALYRHWAPNALLARCGQNSFPIYLYHGLSLTFGTKLATLGRVPFEVELLVGVACALSIPIMIRTLSDRIGSSKWMFGTSRIPKPVRHSLLIP